MKRLFLIALAVLLLAGIGVVVWTVAGLPPVRMVWHYGFSYGPETTGRTLTVEGVEFVEIGSGCFRMGSDKYAEGGDWLGRWCARLDLPWGDQPKPSNEMPVHWVEFPGGFWIARTELNNKQYEAFEPWRKRSGFSPGNRDPMVEVSWDDADEYCVWLTKQSGLTVRLPSESEWECASQGGSRRSFCFGGDNKGLGSYAWYDANSGNAVHEVGTRRANAFGLHDLHGNVWEWCKDTWHPSYEDAPADGVAWVKSFEDCDEGPPLRIYRGGSFMDGARKCRSTSRFLQRPQMTAGCFGFRPALSQSEE